MNSKKLDSYRVLVLNASYEYLNIAKWQRAIKLIFSDKAKVLEEGDRTINSQNLKMFVPSVIRMNYYVKKPEERVPLSRSNIFARDFYCCQYCGKKFDQDSLTIDHIIPRSAGGKDSWDNVVSACKECNSKKANNFLNDIGMKVLKKPKKPKYAPKLNAYFREEWAKYLNIELEGDRKGNKTK